jgi:hypothetical protein
MTNVEMRQTLEKSGIVTSDIDKVLGKFDAEKITELVEAASNPKEAFDSLHKFYPELEVEKLQKQMDFVQEQIEASVKANRTTKPIELNEEELDNVVGGSWFGDVCSWCKNNWKAIAVGAAIVVGTALVCTGVGAVIGAAVANAGAAAAASALTAAVAAAGGGAVTISAASVAGVVAAGAASAAAIGAGVGAAVGGVATGVLAGTGVLGKVN